MGSTAAASRRFRATIAPVLQRLSDTFIWFPACKAPVLIDGVCNLIGADT
jgi:hypothetical protein